jgi:hypothetical protein
VRLILVAVVVTLAACSGGGTMTLDNGSPTTHPPEQQGSPSPTATIPPSTSPTIISASPQGTPTTSATRLSPTETPKQQGPRRTVTESDAGHTVVVPRGTTVLLVLHSTYWTFDGSSNSGVLRASSAEAHHPDPPGTCMPGMGCGTVEQSFTALAVGTASLSAHRSTCGEAFPCSAKNSSFHVEIHVI